MLSCFSHVRLFATPWTVALPGSSVHGILQARMLESCHALLQGIFPTQELNPILCLLHWKVGSLPLESESEVSQSCPTLGDLMDCSLPGSSLHGILQATVLEWVAISFSRGSSQPRDWIQVSCIPGRRFNFWATREAHLEPCLHLKELCKYLLIKLK